MIKKYIGITLFLIGALILVSSVVFFPEFSQVRITRIAGGLLLVSGMAFIPEYAEK
ncbi:hypothetical protein ACQUWN_03690 [Rossellomorea aquimaris]|uniref:hypothetical protein n=1 Tax=Bacillaceae TaxID=186817 RepID=UPI0013B05A67|nr:MULTISPECIES: hypothetical protein [Bacillaceae]